MIKLTMLLMRMQGKN